MMEIEFHIPDVSGASFDYVFEALNGSLHQGDGKFTKLVTSLLSDFFSSPALLTTSCTDAIEIAARFVNYRSNCNIVVPSFTFVSSVLPFVERGAKLNFVEISDSCLNASVDDYISACDDDTVAIVAVHYGGGGTDLTTLRSFCDNHSILLIEDAAQAYGASVNGKLFGTFGHFGALSFHGTKIIGCGEGGALLINDRSYLDRCLVLREKGTNRTAFINGEVDKYTWKDFGSSHLPSEITAAFLFGNLMDSQKFIQARNLIWSDYELFFAGHELDYMRFNSTVRVNGHIFALLFGSETDQKAFKKECDLIGLGVTSHYIPLHTSPFAAGFWNNKDADLSITDHVSRSLLRLPIYPKLNLDLALQKLGYVCESFKV